MTVTVIVVLVVVVALALVAKTKGTHGKAPTQSPVRGGGGDTTEPEPFRRETVSPPSGPNAT